MKEETLDIIASKYDVMSLIDILDITEYDIVRMFADRIEDMKDSFDELDYADWSDWYE